MELFPAARRRGACGRVVGTAPWQNAGSKKSEDKAEQAHGQAGDDSDIKECGLRSRLFLFH